MGKRRYEYLEFHSEALGRSERRITHIRAEYKSLALFASGYELA